MFAMSYSDIGFISVDFEIYGNVQGVFFRQHTYEEAGRLGVVGWVMNTSKGTVKGTIQGEDTPIHNMKWFLEHKGSPYSHIEKAVFTNERRVVHKEYERFTISHGY